MSHNYSEIIDEFRKKFPQAVSKLDTAKMLYDAGMAELIDKPVDTPTATEVVRMQEHNQLLYRFESFLIDKLENERGTFEVVLDLYGEPRCGNLYHPKKYQHGMAERCPLEKMLKKMIDSL